MPAMREQVVKADAEVAKIAARQHGVVTFTQLKRAGVWRSGVYRQVAAGRLYRLDLGDIETDGTRSELERAFLRLCRRHHLPEPEVNVRVAGFTVDFLWRAERLAVETDGYGAHRGRQAFEDDRERELAL